MTVIHPKNLSRLIAPSAMVLSLLLPFEGQAGFQWITPLEQTPLATQPAPAEKTPVAPKKDLPPAVQLPALEPVVASPPEAVPVAMPAATDSKPVVTEAAPVVLTPAVVDHDTAAATPNQPAMDVVAPDSAPAPVATPVAETPAPVETPVVEAVTPAPAEAPVAETPAPAPAPVLEENPLPVPEPAPVALPEPEPAPVMPPKAEIVEPAAMPPEPVSPVVAMEPVAVPSVEPTSPVVAMEPVPPTPIAATPVEPAPQEQKPVATLDDGAVIKGFGKKLPLVVVLKQILPKDHVFAFESGVNPSTTVSWKGGKGWRLVLAETLHKVGLTAHEENNLVSIVRADTHAVAEPASAPLAAVAPPVELTAPVVLQQPEAIEPVKESIAIPSIEPVTVPPPATLAEAVPTTGKIVMPPATLEPPLLPGASDVWKAESGEHLRSVIKRWCERAKVELVWSSEYDYPIQAGVSLTGSFEEAVRNLLSGFVDAKPQPFARLHDNPAAGQRTLVVQSRGNTNGE